MSFAILLFLFGATNVNADCASDWASEWTATASSKDGKKNDLLGVAPKSNRCPPAGTSFDDAVATAHAYVDIFSKEPNPIHTNILRMRDGWVQCFLTICGISKSGGGSASSSEPSSSSGGSGGAGLPSAGAILSTNKYSGAENAGAGAAAGPKCLNACNINTKDNWATKCNPSFEGGICEGCSQCAAVGNPKQAFQGDNKPLKPGLYKPKHAVGSSYNDDNESLWMMACGGLVLLAVFGSVFIRRKYRQCDATQGVHEPLIVVRATN